MHTVHAQERARLLRHGIGYFFALGVPGLVNVAALALFTRLLPPHEYGVYALVLAGMTLGSSVLFQWLRLSLLRFLPGQSIPRPTLLATTGAAFLGVAALLGAAALVAVPLVPQGRLLLLAAVALTWLYAWYEFNLEVARSELAPARFGVMNLTRSLLAIVAGGLLAWAGFGAWGALLGVGIGLVAAILVAGTGVLREAIQGKCDRETLRRVAGYGLPLTLTFALTFVVSQSDRLIIGLLLGPEAAGAYAAGYDLPNRSIAILMFMVASAAYPIIVRALEERGPAAASSQLSYSAMVLLAISIPSAVGISLLAEPVSALFLGDAYRASATALIPWVAAATVLAGAKTCYLDVGFQLGNATKWQVIATGAAALLNIALNLILIPRFGILGAAYATVASYVLAVAASAYLALKVFPIRFPTRDTAKVGLATLVMALALLATFPVAPLRNLALQGAIGGAVYIAAALLLDVGGIRELLPQTLRRLTRARAQP